MNEPTPFSQNESNHILTNINQNYQRVYVIITEFQFEFFNKNHPISQKIIKKLRNSLKID
jgi:hypothetical protein